MGSGRPAPERREARDNSSAWDASGSWPLRLTLALRLATVVGRASMPVSRARMAGSMPLRDNTEGTEAAASKEGRQNSRRTGVADASWWESTVDTPPIREVIRDRKALPRERPKAEASAAERLEASGAGAEVRVPSMLWLLGLELGGIGTGERPRSGSAEMGTGGAGNRAG